MLRECQKINKHIQYEIFPAYNGKEILNNSKSNTSIHEKILLQDKTVLNLKLGRQSIINEKLTPSEIGCALSHLKIYEEIIKRNLEFALIFEDDILIHEDFNLILKPIIELKEKWDIIFVDKDSGIRDFFIKKTIPLAKTKNNSITLNRKGMGILDPIFNRRRLVYVASCYFINNKACQKLLKLGYPIRIPADYLLGYPAFHGLRLYTVESDIPLAYTNKKELQSTIGERPSHHIY